MSSKGRRRATKKAVLSYAFSIVAIPAVLVSLVISFLGMETVRSFGLWVTVAGIGYVVVVGAVATILWYLNRANERRRESESQFGDEDES